MKWRSGSLSQRTEGGSLPRRPASIGPSSYARCGILRAATPTCATSSPSPEGRPREALRPVAGGIPAAIFVILDLEDPRSSLGSRRHRSGNTEHDLLDLIAADHADQLARDAVYEDQHEEPELNGPEMGPYDLAPQTLVRGRQVFQAPPQRQQMLEVCLLYT